MSSTIGILQGRLTPSLNRGIQFFPEKEWEKEFPIAKKIGFECIELLIKLENYETNPLFTDTGIKQINTLKQQNSLTTPSVHAFYNQADWYPEVIEKIIQQANLTGAKVVLVSFFKNNALQTESDKITARKQLSKAVHLAEKTNIKIAIETELVAEELKQLVESFESPAIGVYYDLGNMASLGVSLEAEISLLKKLIVGVHIKDRLKNGGESVLLGDGDTDFETAFDALASIGYNGPYIIQGTRHPSFDDITLNENYLNFIREKLSLNTKDNG